MNKKDVAWTVCCVFLVIALLLSIVLGVMGFYSAVTYLSLDSDLIVGDFVNIPILPNQTNVVSMTFDSSFLPNENIPQTIQISGQNLNSDVKVRVKAQVFGLEDGTFDFITTEHFVLDDDGYYYYDDTLKGGNKITFCNYVITPKENPHKSGEKYILSIIVENLESKFNVKEIWNNVQ